LPKPVLAPFLKILDAKDIAGPFVLVAIESIQAFLHNNVFLQADPCLVSDALSDVVHSIVR
jgi:hypothetical protein